MTMRYTSTPYTAGQLRYDSVPFSGVIAPSGVDANGPYTGTVNTAIALTGSFVAGSDPSPVLTWQVDPSSVGSGVFLPNANVQNPTFIPDTVGAYVLNFFVDPNDGLPVSDSANLTSEAVVVTSVFLTWDDNALSETGYTVQRSPVDNTSFATIATLPANSVDYEDGVTAGTYYYRVFCSNAVGDSDFSNEAGPIVVT